MIKFYDYQKRCIDFINENKYCFITMEGGTGKTLTALEATKDAHTVVIAQNNELKKQWQKEKYDHFEVITLHQAKTNIPDCENIIIDESHKLASPSSERYKKIRKNLKDKEFKKILLLTATPVANNEIDIFNQCSLFGKHFPLCQEYTSQLAFNKHFYNWDKVYVFYLGKMQNQPVEFKDELRMELNNLINIFNYEHENFIEHERKIYLQKKNMNDYIYLKSTSVYADEVFTSAAKLNGLMQLSNSTHTLVDDVIDDDYMQKINEIKKIGLNHDKVVIAYCFKKEKELLMNNLQNITDDIDVFKSTDTKYYIRNIKRCEGVNLPESNVIVFFSVDYSSVNMQQFKWRIKRVNSEFTELYYYYLIFENTVETGVYDVIEKKISKNRLIKNIN